MIDDHVGYYRRCFSSPDGMKVLAHLLADMGLFDEDGDVRLKNYAAKIMNTCGFTNGPFRMEQFVDACFTIQQIEQPNERKHEDEI